LIVIDRLGDGRPFGEEDERVLQAFAASAATAVATAQTAGDVALRRSIEASEAERGRWARELHDETLQQLAGLRVLLSGARRSGDPAVISTAMNEAIDLLAVGIADLRALITDLRPAALDELGAQAALETLTARVAQQSGLEIALHVDLGGAGERHVTEIESTTYRLVQEGLTNVVKHADARHVQVRVTDVEETVEIVLHDDGRGFDADGETHGFGLIGMRERVALVHGTLDVETAPGEGTTLRARIPALRRGGRAELPSAAAG
jgi:signal transduction histidine kinase